MSYAPGRPSRSPLRRDLIALRAPGRRRDQRIVVDDIAGKFARVADYLWERLRRGDGDEELWRQAAAAGWTAERNAVAPRRSVPWCFPLRLGSSDRLADPLAPRCDWLFAPRAVAVWCLVIASAWLLAMTRLDELGRSLGSLDRFVREANPWLIGGTFVATKILHEWGHAVMCRRAGARPGDFGLLFLFGMPCPYCDVTDVWRQPSCLRRAAVMAAGMYVESIAASLALFVWCLANDPATQLFAAHVVLICGVSTILFNANPLLRYDGYYLLADWLGSVDLRQEARLAFRGAVTRRLGGHGYGSPLQSGRRSIGLALYHLLSSVYRLVLGIGIAMLVVRWLDQIYLAAPALACVGCLTAFLAVRWARRWWRALRGCGRWSGVGPARRTVVLAGGAVVVGLAASIPLPRFRHVTGRVDAAEATNVFLPHAGVIERVDAEFGRRVGSGDLLVSVGNEDLEIEVVRLAGKLRLAEMRSQLARRYRQDQRDAAADWETLQAAAEAAAERLAEAERRAAARRVTAPHAGIVIPPREDLPRHQPGATERPNAVGLGSWRRVAAIGGGLPDARPAAPRAPVAIAESAAIEELSLTARVGSFADRGGCWCRVSRGTRLVAVLEVDAEDRAEIDVGSPVTIRLAQQPDAAHTGTVIAVSAIEPDHHSVTRQAAYRVLCRLRDESGRSAGGDVAGVVPAAQVYMTRIGSPCDAVFRLPSRSLVATMREWIGDWF